MMHRLTKLFKRQKPTSDPGGAVSKSQPKHGHLRMSGSREGVRGGGGGVRRRGGRQRALHPTRFQLRKHFRKKTWLRIDSQHVEGQAVDDEEASIPELVFGVFDEEGFERVGDLVAHVGVGEVEAGEDDSLELLRAPYPLPVHQLTD